MLIHAHDVPLRHHRHAVNPSVLGLVASEDRLGGFASHRVSFANRWGDSASRWVLLEDRWGGFEGH